MAPSVLARQPPGQTPQEAGANVLASAESAMQMSPRLSLLKLLEGAIQLEFNPAPAAGLSPGNKLVDKDSQDEDSAHRGVDLEKGLIDCLHGALDRQEMFINQASADQS